MMCVMEAIPPPPRPCTAARRKKLGISLREKNDIGSIPRPAMRKFMDGAAPHSALPMAKMRIELNMTILRPKT